MAGGPLRRLQELAAVLRRRIGGARERRRRRIRRAAGQSAIETATVRVGPAASTSPVRGTKEVPHQKERNMKYMILTYASQRDYDGMSGQASDAPPWSPEDFAAMTLSWRLSTPNWPIPESLWKPEGWPHRCTPDGLGRGTRAIRHRRAVRRDPGGACRLLDRGMRQLRPCDRDRGPAGSLPGTGAGHCQCVRRHTSDHGVG